MSKFKIGDRVKSIYSDTQGTVVEMKPFNDIIPVRWDDGSSGLRHPDTISPVPKPIPDGIVVKVECVAAYGGGKGVFFIQGIQPERLNGKFRLVPVE